jgi:N-acetylglucosaminyl-diphospho-decaprenol L-rhamnosyltransferase
MAQSFGGGTMVTRLPSKGPAVLPAKKPIRVLVVIVNFRVADLTIDCLKSIADEVQLAPDVRVAVCENGTGDDSAVRIQEAIDDNGWASWCSLIASTSNLGFTGGNNIILRPAMEAMEPPAYFLLLNPDTIVRPHAFEILTSFMDGNPHVGIAGGGLENPDGTGQRSAFRFQTPASEFEGALSLGLVSRLLKNRIVAPPIRNEVHQCDWVSGACMMVRREVFANIGLLDEGLFTYFDDCDLCLRACRAGWKTWYVPDARVVHLVGRSSGITLHNVKPLPSYYFQARRRYFLRNHGVVFTALADAAAIIGLALWRLRVLLTNKADRSPPNALEGTIRQSVFLTGFRVNTVKNPAVEK